ncbi:MAG TPA: radical SAM protein [Spirochaetota bacterium]|nr:radical SAM protein [Spirochaetota bacterium]
MSTSYQHIFGPVPSRRLGYSLGIDPVPFKTCSYDCIYCQLGVTTNKTCQRREFFPAENIISEIEKKLKEGGPVDYITLSGSGEPTLYSKIDTVINYIKDSSDKPVAVLTNGSLLWQPEVREQLKRADLVVPSLDAPDSSLFRYINRPQTELDFNTMIQGLIDFRKEFKNKIWLEIFLLGGVTALEAEAKKLAQLAKQIKPDKIQLNTVERPPAVEFAYPVPQEQMQDLARYFPANTEIITDFNKIHSASYFNNNKTEIMNLLSRRPCSIEDIQGALNMHQNEVIKYTEELKKAQKVIITEHNGKQYYYIKTKKK